MREHIFENAFIAKSMFAPRNGDGFYLKGVETNGTFVFGVDSGAFFQQG
jgi:hypothetical protein